MRKILFCLALLACAAPPAARAAGPMWLPLGGREKLGTTMFELDYRSIRLDGPMPAILLRLKLQDPMKISVEDKKNPALNATSIINTLLMRSEIDCAGGTIEVRQVSFLDAADRIVRTLDRAGYDKLNGNHTVPASMPIDTMKALCMWRDLGFHLPDVSIGGNWEEMISNNPPSLLAEAPEKRQYAKGMVLITRRTDWPVTLGEKQSRFAIMVSVYDCAKAESHTTAVVRYDLDMVPILGGLYMDKPDTPQLEANRKRFADACKDPRAKAP